LSKSILTIIFLLIFSSILFCQDAAYKPTYYEEWALPASVLEVFAYYPYESAGLRYEVVLDDFKDVFAEAAYNFDESWQGYGGRIGCDFYPQQHSPNAWFAGPFAGVYNINAGTGGLIISLGGQAGYRWIFDGWTLAPAVMAQFGIGPAGYGGFAGGLGVNGGIPF
jgi:hypothetical protein